jgi:hypothetical protein
VELVNVEYIGVKERRADTVTNTGVVWYGQGDVRAVPAEAWAKLSKHPDIWRLAGDKPKAAKPEKKVEQSEQPADDQPPGEKLGVPDDEKPAQEASGLTPEQWLALSAEDRDDFVRAHAEKVAEAAKPAGKKAKPAKVDLEAMDREQLHALAKERGVKVHPNAGADTVRAKLAEAGV